VVIVPNAGVSLTKRLLPFPSYSRVEKKLADSGIKGLTTEEYGQIPPIEAMLKDRRISDTIYRKFLDGMHRQTKFARSISRLSPSAVYSYAASTLARTDLSSYENFIRNLRRYRAGAFQSTVEKVVDSGLKRQWRFEDAARNYYHTVLSAQESGEPHFKSPYFVLGAWEVKVNGKSVRVSLPPSGLSVPTGDISEYPRFSLPKTFLGESISDGLWDVIILLLWNFMLALLAPLMFLRYDVK